MVGQSIKIMKELRLKYLSSISVGTFLMSLDLFVRNEINKIVGGVMKTFVNLILIVSINFLLLSCGSSKDAGDSYQGAGFIEREKMLVRDNVKDKDRMDKMLKIIDEEAVLLKNFEEKRNDYTKQFMKQMDDYNSSEEELTKTLVYFQNDFKELVLLMLEKNAELKSIATLKEWEDISNLNKGSIFN
jgi:hypothetical protein